MIATQEILTIKKISEHHRQVSVTKKPKIVARWKLIEGKLVCKWVSF